MAGGMKTKLRALMFTFSCRRDREVTLSWRNPCRKDISRMGAVPLLPGEVRFFTKLGGGFLYLNTVGACFRQNVKSYRNAKYLI